MSDLIDRQAALDLAVGIELPDSQTFFCISPEDVEALPSAQPEIIRCKECKFYTEMRQDLNTGICRLACRHLGGDGFCSEAERRTDDH